MKKFRFRLETVLKLRRMAEDAKKRAVGDLLNEIHGHQRAAVEMDAAIAAAGRDLKQRHVSGKIDLGWVGNYQAHVGHLRRSIAQRVEMVTQLQQRLAGARRELSEAAKQTKILEKLREKRKQRYDDELSRAEGNELDDVATRSFLQVRSSA